MNLQDIDTSLQIRTVNNNTTVKASRTKKRRIQYLRTVSRCQDQKSLGGIETIHLRKQLVQCLLTLVISTAVMGITALTDSIDLINKYNTRCILLSFLKKVADTGSTHTNKHLHKFRSGKGKEWHMSLTCYCLGEKSLTGTRRSYKQCALRQLGTDLNIFTRIVKKFHNLLQGLLGLILTCHILKGDPGLLLHIGLSAALSNSHYSTATLIHAAHEEHKKHKQKN